MPARDVPLTIGYWIVSHKATLKRWWAILFLVIMVLASVWVITSMAVLITQEPKIQERMLTSARLTGLLSGSRIGQPAAIKIGQPSLIARSTDRVDVIGWLSNPNQEWGATMVKFHFVVGTTATPATTVAVNPGETRVVSALNVAGSSAVTPQLVVEKTAWTRGTASPVASLFTVEKASWTPTTVTIQGSAVETVTVQATVRNISVYNYYQVEVPVVAKAGEDVVAVDELRIDRWASRATKQVIVSWPYRVTGVTSVEITPTVNQFDQANHF